MGLHLNTDSCEWMPLVGLHLIYPRGKPAVSGFSVLEPLAGGAAVLMAWKLETGRTHQIRCGTQWGYDS